MLSVKFCLFLSRAHDRNKGKMQICQQRTKRAENLHKHAHAVILPTDAFKWSLFLSDKQKN